MPSRQRQRAIEAKRQRKADAQNRPKHRSNYARKRTYLNREGGWGSDYSLKPWKG